MKIFLNLFLIEILRIFFVAKNRKNKISLLFITLIFILVEINYRKFFISLNNRREIFKYICGELLPLISYNFLSIYLISNKRYYFSLIYRSFVNLLFLIFLGKFKIDWFVIGSFSILLVTIIYLIYKYKILKFRADLRRENRFENIKYVVIISFSIFLVLFMLGVFKIQPISIISNSMNPLFRRGDVVIFKKLNEKELNNIQVGSILIYNLENKKIAHRVVKKIKDGNEVFYKTKGDNNETVDSKLVRENQIIGVYLFHIKYLGFPSIWLYEYFE